MPTAVAERPTILHPRTLDAYRTELTRYCSRMLASSFEADDAVQETMIRAWRSRDRFEGRSSVKTWLYRIAINVCYDMLRARNRRPAPHGLGPDPETGIGPGWRGSPEDRRGVSLAPMAAAAPDPSDQAITSESVHHAFAAALHYLPPRQRAVLVLREVLRWPATETAELLGASVASVNSALQRARAKLAEGCPPPPADGDRDSQVVDRYADALGRADMDGLIAQLVADATGDYASAA